METTEYFKNSTNNTTHIYNIMTIDSEFVITIQTNTNDIYHSTERCTANGHAHSGKISIWIFSLKAFKPTHKQEFKLIAI